MTEYHQILIGMAARQYFKDCERDGCSAHDQLFGGPKIQGDNIIILLADMNLNETVARYRVELVREPLS